MKQLSKVALLAIVSVLAVLCSGQTKDLTMSGFVADRASRPVAGARVTVVGAKAKGDAITDSEGAFVVNLAQDVVAGESVRVRIEKEGYRPYERLLAASPAIPLRVLLDPTRDRTVVSAPAPPIERTDSFSTLVPFHAEWTNSPIPLNENLNDPHQEYYDGLLQLANRPDQQPEGWPAYRARSFESLDQQFSFVTKLLQFDIFRSLYFLQRGVAGGVKWTAGVGVTPINKKPVVPPDAAPYAQGKIAALLTSSEFLRPMDELLWKNKPFMLPLGTQMSFVERANPAKGEVLTCTVRLERPGYFWVDFESQPGPAINNQLPAGFSSPVVRGTTTYSIVISMKYQIQRKKDQGFNADQYSIWADSLFNGLHKIMAFEETATAGAGTNGGSPQSSEAPPKPAAPSPPGALRAGSLIEGPMFLREGKMYKLSKSVVPCAGKSLGYGREGVERMRGPGSSKPWLVVEPVRYQFVDWSPADPLDLLFQVEVTNRGEPSIAKDWELCLVATDQTVRRFRAEELSANEFERFKQLGENANSLADVAFKEPIQRGRAVNGWVLFHLPPDLKLETLTGSLQCRDYLDHPSTLVFSTGAEIH
jgi:hypothetical protein